MRFARRIRGLGTSGQKQSSNLFHTGLAEWMTAEGAPTRGANSREA
jgi:hypothetical protein